MTNSDRTRDSAVLRSSTIPSAKSACSGSSPKLVNGKTAIAGFSRFDIFGSAIDGVSDMLVAVDGVSACSLTSATKRTPLRGKVRIIDWASPLSATAWRARLIAVAIAELDTIRPPQTRMSNSSLVTTRSRCCRRHAIRSNVRGGRARGTSRRSNSRR